MVNTKKVELVTTRLEIAQRDTKDRFAIFNECDSIYHGEAKTQPTNSQIHNPYSWANIETVVPRMVAKRPTIIYTPREPGDETNSELLQALFDYWWEKDGAFIKTIKWIKDSLIYGTGVVKVYWKTIEEEVTSYEYGEDGLPLVDEGGNYVEKTEKIVSYDDPCLENVNLYNFFVDPNAKDIQSADWVIHRYWKTFEELEAAGYYKNLKTLKGIMNSQSSDQPVEEKERHSLAYGRQETDDDTVEKIEILEMWDKDGLTILANREVIIREQANPFWHGKIPFIKLSDSIVSNEFYGKGEIEPVKKLQHALNTIQNQSIDNKNMVLMPMWKVKGEIDDSELVARPNGIIHEDEYNTAEPLQFPDVSRSAVEEMQNIKSDIQQALGIYDYTKAAESGVNKTATGIGLIQEAANARFAHKIQLFEESLKELGGFILALYQQFITSERVIRIAGDKGNEYQQIIPAEISGQYDIDVKAGSTQPINKEAERQDVLNLYSIFSQQPHQALNNELQKKILEKFGFDELIDALEEDLNMEQMMQQEQAIGQQAEQAGMDEEAAIQAEAQQIASQQFQQQI